MPLKPRNLLGTVSHLPDVDYSAAMAPAAAELPESIFKEDTVEYEYDILTPEEKAELTSLSEVGMRDHKRRALNALDAHGRTGNVDNLDHAIALLLHLRQTQHGNDS